MSSVPTISQFETLCLGLRGAAIVADISSGQVTHMATYVGGSADYANGRGNSLDTRFATASAGKAFVAVGVMQLVERGLLTLNTRLGDLVDFELHDSWRNVSVRQLLSHTSGVPDYFDEDVMDDYAELWVDFPNYRIRSSRDLLPLFANKPASFPAGERFQYNNSGYVLLGLVIESVTGMIFDDYLAQAVFAPAGMTRTGYYELDRLPQGCAYNYIQDSDGHWYTNIYSVDVKGTGAGGAFTTVIDVASFWAALNSGVLVSRETRDLMWSVHARSSSETESDSEAYGLGFWLDERETALETDAPELSSANEPPALNYTANPRFEGFDPGVSFVSTFDRESGVVKVLVSNYCDNVWQILRAL